MLIGVSSTNGELFEAPRFDMAPSQTAASIAASNHPNTPTSALETLAKVCIFCIIKQGKQSQVLPLIGELTNMACGYLTKHYLAVGIYPSLVNYSR